MLYPSNSRIHSRAATRKTLYEYVNRCGAVTVHRGSLPQFARDLCVRAKDLDTLITHMIALGQVTADGPTLQFSRPEVRL